MTLDDLFNELGALADRADYAMVDVAGRWTGIKGVRVDPETATLFIETED